MSKIILTSSMVAIFALSQAVWAKPPRGNGPPSEAIEACEDKSEGESVSFETPRGDTLEGSCQLIEEQLVAVPANHRPRK